jgi:hypothetical protein
MEKILLGAYLSILAAFITAAASIVKLVNEKESKTTDYRQSWTDSVRKSLSQLIASITLQANYLLARAELVQKLASAHAKKAKPEHEKIKDSITDYLQEELGATNKSIRENRQCIQQNYALTALHFKPHDEIFIKIESKFELANQFLHEMTNMKGEEHNSERKVLKEKISSIVNEITETSRHILKTEWEHVKKGEPAYKTTKNWSLYIGIATFSVLLLSGIYMLAVAYVSPPQSPTQPRPPATATTTGPSDAKQAAATERVEVHQNVTVPQMVCKQASSQKASPKDQCKPQPVQAPSSEN